MKFSLWVILALVGLGVVGGALSGLLGIGSGIIMVPVLSAIWAKNPDAQKLAQGTALAVMVPMAIAGSLSYHFGGQQDNLRLSLLLGLWAIIVGGLALSLPMRFQGLLGVTDTLDLVNWNYVVLLALGAVVGSMYLGAPLAAYLPSAVLKKIFGFFIIIVGLRMVGFWAWVGSLFMARPAA